MCLLWLICAAVRGCIGRYLPYQTNPRLSTSTLLHKPYSLLLREIHFAIGRNMFCKTFKYSLIIFYFISDPPKCVKWESQWILNDYQPLPQTSILCWVPPKESNENFKLLNRLKLLHFARANLLRSENCFKLDHCKLLRGFSSKSGVGINVMKCFTKKIQPKYDAFFAIFNE